MLMKFQEFFVRTHSDILKFEAFSWIFNFLEHLVKFRCIFHQVWCKDDYFLAKVGADTAENDPCKVWWFGASKSEWSTGALVGNQLCAGGRARWKLNPWGGLKLKKIKSTLEGSFSSVSTPIFASKYAFCSIFRDLHIPHSSRELKFQNFRNFENSRIFPFFWQILTNSFRDHIWF